jgi:hypothetical protein
MEKCTGEETIIYLSSKITGLLDEDWFDNFMDMENNLLDRNFELQEKDPTIPDIRIINPATFSPDLEDPQWIDYITEDLRILVDNADVIYLFGKWWSSCGCWIELLTAIRNDKVILINNLGMTNPIKILTKFFRKRM